ncbi:MAG: hypothetical protein HWD61_12600 [Parachlamydiaceae bacterium]|nr:MAG: hypothetical protein HWD61_12600 [Parachlamydiaceae bacterium]
MAVSEALFRSINVNLLPLETLYLLTSLTEKLAVYSLDFEGLADDKLVHLVQKWKERGNSPYLINLCGFIPSVEIRAEKLDLVFRHLNQSELRCYMEPVEQTQFVHSCRNIMTGSRRLDEKAKQRLTLYRRQYTGEMRLVWLEALEHATLEQLIFLLYSDTQGSYINHFDRMNFEFLKRSIQKDVAQLIHLIRNERNLTRCLNLLQFFSDEQDGLIEDFIEELAAQEKLIPVLSQADFEVKSIKMVELLTVEQLKTLVRLQNEADQKEICLNENASGFCKLVFHNFFDLELKDFLCSEDDIVSKGYACFDEIAQNYPNKILNVIHGIILAMDIKFKLLMDKNPSFKEIRWQLDQFLDSLKELTADNLFEAH